MLVALALAACAPEKVPVVLPAPGASTPLALDGELRTRDLDELSPELVALVRDEGRVSQGGKLSLLVPGSDTESTATSMAFAQALREAGWIVRRTHRRKLESAETLVEVVPMIDGAMQIDGGKTRAWRLQLEIRLFKDSEEPAVVAKRLLAEATAPIPQQ